MRAAGCEATHLPDSQEFDVSQWVEQPQIRASSRTRTRASVRSRARAAASLHACRTACAPDDWRASGAPRVPSASASLQDLNDEQLKCINLYRMPQSELCRFISKLLYLGTTEKLQ